MFLMGPFVSVSVCVGTVGVCVCGSLVVSTVVCELSCHCGCCRAAGRGTEKLHLPLINKFMEQT